MILFIPFFILTFFNIHLSHSQIEKDMELFYNLNFFKIKLIYYQPNVKLDFPPGGTRTLTDV